MRPKKLKELDKALTRLNATGEEMVHAVDNLTSICAVQGYCGERRPSLTDHFRGETVLRGAGRERGN